MQGMPTLRVVPPTPSIGSVSYGGAVHSPRAAPVMTRLPALSHAAPLRDIAAPLGEVPEELPSPSPVRDLLRPEEPRTPHGGSLVTFIQRKQQTKGRVVAVLPVRPSAPTAGSSTARTLLTSTAPQDVALPQLSARRTPTVSAALSSRAASRSTIRIPGIPDLPRASSPPRMPRSRSSSRTPLLVGAAAHLPASMALSPYTQPVRSGSRPSSPSRASSRGSNSSRRSTASRSSHGRHSSTREGSRFRLAAHSAPSALRKGGTSGASMASLPTEPAYTFEARLHETLVVHDMAAAGGAATPTGRAVGVEDTPGMINVLSLPARDCSQPGSYMDRLGAVSMRGRNPAAVKINQDALLMAEHSDSGSVLLAVFDGHGQYGREVSQYLRAHLAPLLFGSTQFEHACGTAATVRRRAEAGVRPQPAFSTLRHRGDRALSDVEVHEAQDVSAGSTTRRAPERASPTRSRSAHPSAPSASAGEAAAVLADLTEARAVCEVLGHTLLVLESQMLGSSGINCSLSGATATVVLLRRGFAHVVNVGDSRAVLVSSREPLTRIDTAHLSTVCAHVNSDGGQGSLPSSSTLPMLTPTVDAQFVTPDVHAAVMTVDHKPDLPRERQRILACGGRIQATKIRGTNQTVGLLRVWLKSAPMPGLNMSRSIGDLIGKQAGIISSPYKVVRPLTEHDCAVVIASDGIWDWVTSNEAACLALSSADTWEASMRLARLARARWLVKTNGGADDTSIIVARLRAPEASSE